MSGKPLGKIVTFFNQKGGVGKTTSTCQLAGTFGHRGYDVLVADLDAQQTSAAWLSRADGANFPATLWSGFRYKDSTAAELGKLAAKYDLIFVDCAPAVDQPGTWASLLVSDLALVPTKLSPADTDALPAALALAKKALITSGRDYPVRILPTAFRRNRADERAALEVIAADKVYPEFWVMKQVLSDRVAFTRSMLYGATVHSMPNAKDAITEIDALADAVAKLLKIPATKKG
ncbi:MAG: ParA family protein [Hydrogenophaga sp.]|uniref:ParA family protein n=1 Tax=Hydrogenophaga sp. TaxID=1904254 RepID=UPI002621D9F4|nr:ParA family protein [Hydrogenophaga sp.]MCV0439071.1 ParA family protein [Hydrogenophaga sp.]